MPFVISRLARTRPIIFAMGLHRVFADFFTPAAIGAASVLLIIVFVGLGMPKRSTVTIRRNQR